MPSLHSLARATGHRVPRRAIAAAANLMLAARHNDPRRFAVDPGGRWINRQPAATFVSPDIFTAHYHQVDAAVRDHWCQRYTPKPGDTVIDVGAGIGEDMVVFSKLVGPTGRVIAIEAHPGTFACLQQTIARSGLGNVTPVACAITAKDGVITISDQDNHLANSILPAAGGVEVTARSLDSLMAELGIDTIDLLKMNIEGAEREAMGGMARSAPHVRHAAVSCHDFIADQGGGDQFRTRDFVRQALVALGFEPHARSGASQPWHRDTLYADRPPTAFGEPG